MRFSLLLLLVACADDSSLGAPKLTFESTAGGDPKVDVGPSESRDSDDPAEQPDVAVGDDVQVDDVGEQPGDALEQEDLAALDIGELAPDAEEADVDPGDTTTADANPSDEDTGPEDAGAEDAEPEDIGTEDVGPEDVGLDEVGVPDVGPEDVGPEDVEPEDVGAEDLGPEDVEPEDLGPEDVGPEDAGPEDLGAPDVGPEDIGPEDVGPPAPVCGNVLTEAGEDCDDGNGWAGDGCSPACIAEGPWSVAYFEDFEDEKAQGWSVKKGGCGDSESEEHGGVEVWVLSSDWQSMMRAGPTPLGALRAWEARLRLVNNQGTASLAFRATANSPATVDMAGYNLYLKADGAVTVCSTAACGSAGSTSISVGTWITVRFEEDLTNGQWRASINGTWLTEGTTAGLSDSAMTMEFHANGKCNNDRLQIGHVKVEHK